MVGVMTITPAERYWQRRQELKLYGLRPRDNRRLGDVARFATDEAWQVMLNELERDSRNSATNALAADDGMGGD